MSFTSLGLSELLSETTKSLYETPTTLQEQAIPVILQNNDLMVAAPSAETGKIGSFILPIIEKLFPPSTTKKKHVASKHPKALILAATADEAIQITEYFKAYSFDFPLTLACVLDNTNPVLQAKILSHGVDVLVASPARLTELLEQQAVDLSKVELFVLDEAELLTNEDHIKNTKQVIDNLPTNRQNLLYASSFTDDVIVLAHFLLKNPERIEINITPSIEHIKQSVYYIPTRQKSALLVHLINKHKWPHVLVFTRTKYGATRLSTYLESKGIHTGTIYTNKTPNIINKTLADFKEGILQVLIATDIQLENLDVSDLSCIVNFDLPYIEDEYIQRINTIEIGEAISFVNPEEEKLLLVIEDFIKQKIPDGDMADFIYVEEVNEENPDRFKRIFRHPAVGRKSRKKVQPTTNEQDLQETTDNAVDSQKVTRTTRTKTKTTRNLYNKHRRTQPVSSITDELPPDRPEDEFRDDDYDNFGNSVDYVSPYQDKSKNNGNKRFSSNKQGAATATAKAPRAQKPKTARTQVASEQATTERRPRNSLYRRNNRTTTTTAKTTTRKPREIMANTPPITNDFQEPQQRKASSTVTSIIHRKHPRIDRLPTMEQLDSLANRHIPKGEKPMLLSRKNSDDE